MLSCYFPPLLLFFSQSVCHCTPQTVVCGSLHSLHHSSPSVTWLPLASLVVLKPFLAILEPMT